VSSVLEEIVDFCRQNLDVNAEACEYLFKERGLNKGIVEQFKIGYCPLDLSALYKRVSPQKLREIGFIRDAKSSQFPNRIIFPVWNQYGELVAIAGFGD
jgi:DNA primase